MDYQLKKEVYTEDSSEHCRRDWTMQDYVGGNLFLDRKMRFLTPALAACVKSKFREEHHSLLQAGEIRNCSLPWVQSMLDDLRYNSSNPCSVQDMDRQSVHYEKFLKRAATFQVPDCQSMSSSCRQALN
jgi:hypothetical protein